MALAPAPLHGLRVLDLSTGVAGPYAARVLREAGAEVLKLEEPLGDSLRDWSASYKALPPGEDGGLFQFLNAGKQGVPCDLMTAEGREILGKLSAEADILIENFGPLGFAERNLRSLQDEHPHLSIISISWWGHQGPWATRPANEWTLQAAIGMTARRGYPERGPVACGGRFGEWSAGSCAAVAALAALQTSRQTGRGEHVDLSVFESMLLCMTQYHTLDGQFRPELLPAYVECPSIERTSDGWVGLACVTPPQWEAFCEMMDRPDWAENPKLVSADERMKIRDTLHRDIVEWMAARTTAEVIEAAALRRIPVAPVGDGTNFSEMEQMVARGLLEDAPGGFLQPRPPIRLHGTERMPLAAAPSRHPAPGAGFSSTRDVAATAISAGAKPLSGIRVLDLSAFWAGPMCTSTLAALGADVIKVEAGKRPDGMRFVNTMPLENFWEAGSIFHGANLGKRGITIALDSEEGADLFLRLVADADIVVENYSVRVMEQFGFTLERLQSINPRLTLVRMPSWGLDGPWRDRVGFAMTIEQSCGLAWISGYEDRPLTVNVCDSVGALHTTCGILMALEDTRRTGRGRLLEVPLVEPGLTIGADLIIEASRGNEIPREGNRGPLGTPQGCFQTNDGEWVALSVETDSQWKAFAQAAGKPDWAAQTRWETSKGRRRDQDLIEKELAVWAGALTGPAAEQLLIGAGVPASIAVNAHRVLPHPQLEARGFLEDFEHEFTGRMHYPTLPWRPKFAANGWYEAPPPTLGQHNREVLGASLGLSADELDSLEEQGVISSKLG
jgi:crotonobetainyl-CoA:carnitine CoA-transferase CaiB-like acyl-CoA transferase